MSKEENQDKRDNGRIDATRAAGEHPKERDSRWRDAKRVAKDPGPQEKEAPSRCQLDAQTTPTQAREADTRAAGEARGDPQRSHPGT